MKDLEYFKKELIKILDKKEREEKTEIKKSLAFTMDMLIEKSSSGYPIGTIREWKGKKYQKIAPGKWRRKYSSEEKGIRMSIAALKKAIDKCSTSQELLNLVLQNRDRFADDNGRPLPIVKELSEYVSKKNDDLEYISKEGKTQKEYAKELKDLKRRNAEDYNKKRAEHIRQDIELNTVTYNQELLSRKEAEKEISKHKNKLFENKETELKVSYNSEGAGKLISQKAVDKSINNGYSREEHFTIASHITDIFKNANLISVEPDRDSDINDNVTEVRRYATKFILNGKEGFALMTVKINKDDTKKMYAIELNYLAKKIELATSGAVKDKSNNANTHRVDEPRRQTSSNDNIAQNNSPVKYEFNSVDDVKSFSSKISGRKKKKFVVKKSFADNFMNKRSIPTMQKSIFVRGDFDAYRISDEELKEHSIFGKTEDGYEYDLQNPTENFYYTLKKNLEKSLTWSGHKLQDRTSWNGLKISIENKKGSVRRGVDKDGHQWATKMHFDYGYIRGSEGTDGDHLDCVSPDTKILMANYTEKRADEIVLGDELVGIEIETHQYQQRKQIKTKVVNLSKGVDEMLEITLSNGVKLNTTKGHLHYIFKNRRDKIWKRADELKVGDRLTGIFNHKDLAETEEYKKGYLYGAYLGDGSVSFDETKQVYCDIRKGVAYADVIYRVKRFWNDLGLETSDVRIKQARQTKSLLKGGRKITSKMDMAIFCIRGIDKIRFVKNILVRNAESFEWCRGYLAGIYDTDGCLNNRHELQITQTKNQNEFMEFTKKCIATLGFNAVQRNNEIKLNSNLMADNITMEFTQLLKPSLEKKRNFLGQTYRFEPVEIVSIKAYKGNFIAIQTDKQTYIANGFVTHNCYIGDNEDAKKVYIVHQNDPVTHKYDEDKCMLGFNTLEDAKKAYLMQYDRPGFLGKIDTMDFDEFKEFILLKRNHGKKIIKSYSDFVKSIGENFDFETMRKVCII